MSAAEATYPAACGVIAFICMFVLMGTRPAQGRQTNRGLGWVRRAVEALQDVERRVPAMRRLRERGVRARRRATCLRELPQMLDVVNLGLLSGLSFDASLELYCEHFHTPLSASFRECLLSWRMGTCTRDAALESLAEEMDVAALRSFAATVSQALTFGSPLAAALERQAHAIRDEQRSELEEEIERAPVRMLIPLGTLVVPAMLLAILGPLLGGTLLAG